MLTSFKSLTTTATLSSARLVSMCCKSVVLPGREQDGAHQKVGEEIRQARNIAPSVQLAQRLLSHCSGFSACARAAGMLRLCSLSTYRGV